MTWRSTSNPGSIGQTSTSGRRTDQPPLTPARRDTREVELNRGAPGREVFRMHFAMNVPHQQTHIEFVVAEIGAVPSLAPFAQHVDDRRELPCPAR